MTGIISLFSKLEDSDSHVKGTLAAILYGACSISMAFINKALMTSLEFDFPVFIMVIQMAFTITVLEVLSWLHLISMPKYTLQRGKMFALPAFFYGVNSLLGLNALSHMNVAMYGVLKRCVPLVTMFLMVGVLKKPIPSRETMASVFLLTMGCVVAGYGDLKFNLLAYTCGAFSNITQALYLLMVQRCTEKDLSTVETLQLNSFNTLPFLIIYTFISGEIFEVTKYHPANNFSFFVVFIVAVSMGCLLNYSLFLCTSKTSALTTSVVGGIKAMVQTLFGLFTFGGISHNMPTYVGISMNLFGGLWYIYAKYIENKAKNILNKTGMKKIISLSTAEDFKDLAKGNGYSSLSKSFGLPSDYKTKNGNLHSIVEERYHTESETVPR